MPDYDFATQLAERGHTSVIVDRLGYGASDKPPGNATCFGSEADVAHQMVQALRNGTCQTGSDEPAKFSKVNIGGASVGGLISHIEAYTFSDVDAVINMSWGDFAATPFTIQELADVLSRCAQGGDEGPVQVIFGDADAVFGPQPLAAEQQAARYTGSPKVTTTIIPEASHYPLVEANHLQMVDGVDTFLTENGS